MVQALEINPTSFPAARFSDVSTILNLVIPLITIGAAVLFLVMGFFGAFTIITAGGDPEKVKKAQKIFKFSILGLAIVLGAFLIVKLIAAIFNIQGLPL